MTSIEEKRRAASKEWLVTRARPTINSKMYYKPNHYKPVTLPRGVRNCKVVGEANGREWTGLKTHRSRRKDKTVAVPRNAHFPPTTDQTPAFPSFSAFSFSRWANILPFLMVRVYDSSLNVVWHRFSVESMQFRSEPFNGKYWLVWKVRWEIEVRSNKVLLIWSWLIICNVWELFREISRVIFLCEFKVQTMDKLGLS